MSQYLYSDLTVDMCVSVGKACPITYLVTADHQVEFSFGGRPQGFHYAFDADALRQFVMLGGRALLELADGTRVQPDQDTEPSA